MDGKRSPNCINVAWATTGEDDHEVPTSKVKVAATYLARIVKYEEVLVQY